MISKNIATAFLAIVSITIIGCGKKAELQEGVKKSLIHQVSSATSYKTDLSSKVPAIDPAQNCIQWVKLDDTNQEQVELHAGACPADRSVVSAAALFTSLIKKVDRGNSGQFADYDLYVVNATTQAEVVVGRIFFNDTRTVEQGKAILNGLCQVASLAPAYDAACTISATGVNYAVTLK